MSLFPDVPGHEGKVLKIPPRAGLRGVVHYTDQTGPGVPEDGTEVQVLGPGRDEQHVRVFAVASGKEFDLPHWVVDCGQAIFRDGEWRLRKDE